MKENLNNRKAKRNMLTRAAEGISEKLSKNEFDSLVTAIKTDPETFLKFLDNVKNRSSMP